MESDDIRSTDLLAVVREIRESDCGAWLKPGSDGEAKRLELMNLLDKLYKVAGIKNE